MRNSGMTTKRADSWPFLPLEMSSDRSLSVGLTGMFRMSWTVASSCRPWLMDFDFFAVSG